jgi:photosystem II stability/assembly factor-like uncharacterized protein
MFLRLLPAVLGLTLILPLTADPSGVDPAFFQDLRWRLIGPFRGGRVLAVTGVPGRPERFYFGAVNGGVWETSDAARTWRPIFDGQSIGSIGAIAVAPKDPRVLYVGSGEADMRSDIAQGDGVYRSADGGRTWAHLGLDDTQQIGRILVDPADPDRVFVAALGHPYGPNEGGLYRSDDAGASWTHVSGDRRIWGRGWYFGGVSVEPADADVVYALNVSLYRSQDGGKTFAPVKGAPGGDDYHDMWIDPTEPRRRILASDQGAVVSVNGGESWSTWHNQPTGQMYHVITDRQFPYWVYGAQQDSGAAAVPSRTGSHNGITMAEFREFTAGGENDMIAPDPTDPQVIYGGRVDRLDLRTGQTRSIDPTLIHGDVERYTWTLPLQFSRRDPHVLYFARERLFRTEDRGEHWSAISPDLTRVDPGVPANLDATTAADAPRPSRRHGVIYAIAPSRLLDRDIWVGTDDGLVWRTRDEGAHWQDVTPKALTAWSKVGILETSHFDAETAYAAIDRHRLDDSRPYVYRTHDGGGTWTLAASGIPDGSFVNAVREDPVQRGLLYAGTERGVYVSFDDGDHWQSLQQNLPVTSVRDIDVHGNDLVLATHGRAFWIMDDVAPLRQVGSDSAGASAWLFAPAAVPRMRPAGFTGTPLPKDEPLASNPPAGAHLDYVLKPGIRDPVTLRILDGRGELVRQYRSDDKLPPVDLGQARQSPEWLSPPAAPRSTPGMHRFVWSLRYPAPASMAEENPYADGVWAPPGRYTVELNADGQTLRQGLVVEPDPRVELPPEVYAAQFMLARRIEAAAARVATAVKEAEQLHREFTTKPGASGADRARAKRIDFEVQVLLGPQFGDRPVGMPAGGLKALRPLATKLRGFADAVDGADGPPSPDVEKGFSELEPAVAATLARWQAITTQAGRPDRP